MCVDVAVWCDHCGNEFVLWAFSGGCLRTFREGVHRACKEWPESVKIVSEKVQRTLAEMTQDNSLFLRLFFGRDHQRTAQRTLNQRMSRESHYESNC